MAEYIMGEEKMMKDLNLYFEIKDMSEDDEGNLFPAGIKVTIAKNIAIETYEKMLNEIEEVDEKTLMKWLNMDELFDIDKARLISQEEYERLYGDEE